MTDIKRLLNAATPLPWFEDSGKIGHDDFGIGEMDTTFDAALIVHAVNALPDYEAAVNALRRLLINGPNHTNYEGCADGMPWPTDYVPDDVECDACQAVLAARSVLRRLRDEVSA